MNSILLFLIGAFASEVSEIFWNGVSRSSIALWGGAGMLLLRRILLRFPTQSRALLSLFGALLLIVLGLAMMLIRNITDRAEDPRVEYIPSFSYGLYRFLLIAPAYTIIEYLETCFGM